MKYISVLLMCTFFIATCNPAKAQTGSCADSIYTGSATFYLVSGPGYCSYPIPASPIYTAALNPVQYDTAVSCGGCIQVTSSNATVILTVEDICPSCPVNNMDISMDADTLSPGGQTTAVQWKFVGCPVLGPVQYHFVGSNPYYLHLQVRNHRYPVQKLEYKSGNNFIAMTRQTDSYFVASANGDTTPYTFRVTDILGDVIEDSGIVIVNDSLMPGSGQFPVCTPATGIANMPNETYPLQLLGNPSGNGSFTVLNSGNTLLSYGMFDLTGRQVQCGIIPPSDKSATKPVVPGIYLLHCNSPSGATVFNRLVTVVY